MTRSWRRTRSRRRSPTIARSTACKNSRNRRSLRRTTMAITLTERAARHVSNFLAKRGRGFGLRLGVQTSGCSGLAYKLEYADAINPEDATFESHGVKVIIDPKSLEFLDGTEHPEV